MQDFPKLFQWGPQQKSLTLHALLGKPNKLTKKTLSLESWPTWWWWSKVRSPFHRMRLKLTNEVQALPFLIGHNCGSWKVERLVFFFFPFKADVCFLNHTIWEIHVDTLHLHRGHRLGIIIIVSDRHSFTKLSSHLICVKQSATSVPGTASTWAGLL